MAWCLVSENSFIYVLDLSLKKRSTVVVDVKEGPSKHLLKVTFIEGESKYLDMRDFKAGKTEFSSAFSSFLESRTSFVKKFTEKATLLRVSESSSSSESSALSDTDISTNSVSEAPSTVTPSRPHIAREKVLAKCAGVWKASKPFRKLFSEEKYRGRSLAGSAAHKSTPARPAFQHLQKLKVIHGDCLKVHVTNLKAPAEHRMVRPLDTVHVEKLRKGFLIGGMQFKVLAGVFVSGSIDQAMVPGGVVVEVIGGNHSRVALQSLYDSGMVGPSVLVTIYRHDISVPEALAVGVFHNQIDEDSLTMTFLDKSSIVRAIKKRTKKWSGEAKMVFGYQSTSETRTKLRTMAALADVKEGMWIRIVGVIRGWNEKKPIRQTAFTKFVTLTEETQERLLDVWETNGYKAYLKELLPEKNERSEKRQSEKVDSEVHLDGTVMKKELERLKAENSKKDSVIQTMKKENNQLKAETTEQNEVIKRLQCEVRKLTMMMSNGTDEKEDSSDIDSSDEETPSKDRPVKRQLDVCRDDDLVQTPDKRRKITFSVGEKVWAHYEPDDKAYPAKVIGIKGNKKKGMSYNDSGYI